MTLQELVDFATGDRDDNDPERGIEMTFEVNLHDDYRGHPYPLEVASIDYVEKMIWLY